jgi:hypothetical protein
MSARSQRERVGHPYAMLTFRVNAAHTIGFSRSLVAVRRQ